MMKTRITQIIFSYQKKNTYGHTCNNLHAGLWGPWPSPMTHIFEAELGSLLGSLGGPGMCGLVCPLVSRVEGYIGNPLQIHPTSLFSIILDKNSSFIRYSDYTWLFYCFFLRKWLDESDSLLILVNFYFMLALCYARSTGELCYFSLTNMYSSLCYSGEGLSQGRKIPCLSYSSVLPLNQLERPRYLPTFCAVQDLAEETIIICLFCSYCSFTFQILS